jgi:transposase
MKPYSKDLRLRVLAAASIAGCPEKEVAKTFGASLPTIERYLKKAQQTRDIESKPITGAPARKGAALDATLPQNRLGSTPI